MIFTESKLQSAFLVTPQPLRDERGFFARCFCKEEYRQKGIEFECVQCNLSYNRRAGTLRGMHYQKEPYSEKKIVTCISGSVFDVIVDLRKDSPTYLLWEGFLLSEKNHESLFIPEGVAHGFITLEDNTCLYYQMSEFYHKGFEGGICYNDPKIGIEWPWTGEMTISERDRQFPLL